MKFNSAQQMLDYINSNHDLYSPKAEIYVFNYNEAGSIATYRITEDEAKVLSEKIKNGDEEYWAALLGVGGSIWDDPSHECYKEGQTSNLGRCEELLEFEDWILTEHYLGTPVPLKVEMTVELTQQDVDDIMCCALEGGINYWCNKAEVVESKYYGEYASEQISRGGSLRLYDCEEDDVYVLDLEKFIAGFKSWLANGYDVHGAVQSGKIDCCNIDADDADQIVQFALFGDIVYG